MNGISSDLPWTNASAENSSLWSPAVQVADGFLQRMDFPFIAPPVKAAACTEGCPGLGDSIHVQQDTGKGPDPGACPRRALHGNDSDGDCVVLAGDTYRQNNKAQGLVGLGLGQR